MNWDEIDKEMGNTGTQYKTYAPNGEHKVKLEKVEVVDREGWKSPALRFIWSEDDKYKYPKSVNHWLSLENRNYRASHNRAILMECGIEKTKAQQLIEGAEKDISREGLKKGYQALYDRLAQRHPEVTIAIQDQVRNGQPVKSDKGTTYSESDFANGYARTMQHHDTIPADEMGEPALDLDEIPFD